MMRTRSMDKTHPIGYSAAMPVEHVPLKSLSPQGTGLTKWREVHNERQGIFLSWEEPAAEAQGGYAATALKEALGEDEAKKIVSIRAYTKEGKPLFGPKVKGFSKIGVEAWTPSGQKDTFARIPRRLIVKHQDGSTRVIDGYIFTNILFSSKDENIFTQQMKIVLWFEQRQDNALTEKVPGKVFSRINQEVFSLALANPIFKFSTEEVIGDKIIKLKKDHEVILLDLKNKPNSSQTQTALAFRFLSDKILLEKMGGVEKLNSLKFKINYQVLKPHEEVKVKKSTPVVSSKRKKIKAGLKGAFQEGEQEDVVVPLVGEVHKRVDELFTEENREIAQLLNSYFTFCKIKGDGHCMFRAIAVSLLDKYTTAPKKLTAIVSRARANMVKSLSKTEYQNIFRSIRLLGQGSSIQEIMLNKTFSDTWVKFLRNLSAAEILSQSKEDLIHIVPSMVQELNDKEVEERFYQLSRQKGKEIELEVIRKEIVTKYLIMKTSMSEKIIDRTFGTDLELISLSRALELTIVLLDLGLCATNRQFAYNIFPLVKFISSNNPPPLGDLFLSFSNIHYNTLFSKIEP